MSFNSAFLSPSRPSERERQAAEAEAAERAFAARSCYRKANLLVISAMILIALPQLGLAAWSWHIVGVVACIVSVLAILMMMKGTVGNGVLSLIFAWIILPAWIPLSPSVIKVSGEFYQTLKKEWVEKVMK